MLFEASWEVCNKVGGIYTVVKSKVELVQQAYSEYFLIGPYFDEKARIETQQVVPPDRIKSVFDRLESEGIKCYFGKWHVRGEPSVILVNFHGLAAQKSEIKKWLYEDYQIETHLSSWDFEEPMIWAYAVGKLLQYMSEEFNDKKIVSHFHEWLAGIALLHLKSVGANIKTVFTTHATMLGRSLCGQGNDLYSMLDNLKPDEEAKRLGVVDKFQTEKACATKAEVFTTVSEITSIEAEKILGRKADVLVLNGLDIQKFPNFEECSIKHKQYRDVIREFLSYYFFPYYKFDVQNTLIFFIVGRYEFKNKGLDIFIKALGKLNDRMKKEGSRKNVATFFWIPSGVNGIKTDLLEAEDRYEQIKEFVDRNLADFKSRLIQTIMTEDEMSTDQLFDKDFTLDAKKLMMRFNKPGMPQLCTHNLINEDQDAIISAFRQAGLDNEESDPVKVISYPVYLDGNDNLLGLKYYDALQGCHLGVFPSYYEPWGYTPLESAALGVPAVTTDLAGFGRFIRKRIHELKKEDTGGIYILDRYNRDEKDVVEDFSEILYNYAQLHRKGRVEEKMEAKELSELADWKVLVDNYIEAHNLALKR